MSEPLQRIPVYSADKQVLSGSTAEANARKPSAVALVSDGSDGSVWGQSVADVLPEFLTNSGITIQRFTIAGPDLEAGRSLVTLPRRLARLFSLWRQVVTQVDNVLFVADTRRGFSIPMAALAILTRYFGKQPILISDSTSENHTRGWRLVRQLTTVIPVHPEAKENGEGKAPEISLPPVALALQSTRPDGKSIQPYLWCPHVIETEEALITIVRAMRLIGQKYPRARLVGVLDQQLATVADSLIASERITGVTFFNSLSEHEVRKLAAQADICLCADSTFQYAPGTLMAALSGQPVIVLDESLEERDDPEAAPTGCLLGDHAALAEIVCHMTESPDEADAVSHRCQEWATPFQMYRVAPTWIAALGLRA